MQLFTKEQAPKSPKVTRMLVIDAGTEEVMLRCVKCSYETGWIDWDPYVSRNQYKRGLPCPQCNPTSWHEKEVLIRLLAAEGPIPSYIACKHPTKDGSILLAAGMKKLVKKNLAYQWEAMNPRSGKAAKMAKLTLVGAITAAIVTSEREQKGGR